MVVKTRASEPDSVSDSDNDSNEMPAGVKLPEFWPLQAQLWFHRADAEFDIKNVTVEKTKFSHLVAALPVEVAARVADVITSPDPTIMYTSLRGRLLDTYTLDSYQRFRCLLDMPATSADKPSALLDSMLTFLPESENKEQPGWMFKNLFLHRLPSEIRTNLMPHKNEPVRKLATRGDALWSGLPVARPAPAAFAITADDDEPEVPVHSCCAVKENPQYCWYHANFGTSATKCRPPCKWINRAKPQGNGRGGKRN